MTKIRQAGQFKTFFQRNDNLVHNIKVNTLTTKYLLFCFLLTLLSMPSWSVQSTPVYPNEGIVSRDVDSFYDINVNYFRFPGRITDKDNSETIFKVNSETGNVKFFKVGDRVEFVVQSKEKKSDPCRGTIRDVEEDYFVIYVASIHTCYPKGEYVRRGTQLLFYSSDLAYRIYTGSKYRKSLLIEKEDFLRQLNKINHFLWSYEEEKAKVASSFDQRIVALEKEKKKALDHLTSLRKDSMNLQKELIKRLDELDFDLRHYRVERQELFHDRWHLDHDLNNPVGRRPQAIKLIKEKETLQQQRRWHDYDFN